MRQGKPPPPQQVELSPEEANGLRQRIESNDLTQSDIKLLLGLIAFNEWLQERLSRAKLTIKRLNQLFGFKNEGKKKRKKSGSNASSESKVDESLDPEPAINDATKNTLVDTSTGETDNQPTTSPQWNPDKNHGRRSHKDYKGCPVKEIPFDNTQLLAGFCPDCAVHNTQACVYAVDPMVLVFLEGRPLVSGYRYALNRVRCSVCQTYFTAPLPAQLKDQPKYLPSAVTSIALSHYYAGQPFHRIEMLQAAQQVPLADSTQYELMWQLYDDVIEPVFITLICQAANGQRFYFDDTVSRVLEQPKKKTTHAHTSAFLIDVDAHRIHLFLTSDQKAGKEFETLLANRTSTDEFMTMTDASSSNFVLLRDELLSCWSLLLCLSHARRRFVELEEDDNDDVAFVVNCLSKVYANDHYCKRHKLNDTQRLVYHQTHSAPLLSALRIWLNNLLLYHRVEPNSRLGEAIVYLLKYWHWLTQFLRVPGAPLDNNLCEQAIKIVIRYRRNSLFYRTQMGAIVGDGIMSVVHTARQAGVNVYDYLNTLQIHAESVNASPEAWLPWNYQATVADQTESSAKAS